ncbi:hypothetical protein BOSP111201_13115 [Bordetella sputigena]
MGNRTGYTYDKLDRLLTTSHAVVASYTVNSAFRLVNTAVSSLVESNTYDQMGHRLTTTDGAGATTYYRYDMRGNVVGVRQPGIGVEVRSAYDAQGNKIFESDANSNGATWTYDYFGHLIGHKDIGGAQYFYTYNSAWQLVDEANTRGQHFTYSYDSPASCPRSSTRHWARSRNTSTTTPATRSVRKPRKAGLSTRTTTWPTTPWACCATSLTAATSTRASTTTPTATGFTSRPRIWTARPTCSPRTCGTAMTV